MRKILLFLAVGLAMLAFWYYLNNSEVSNSSKPKGPAARPEVAAYGSWLSPLTAESLFEGVDSVSYLSVVDNELYFIERQAAANGRNILLKLDALHTVHTLSPLDISVRSRVHEYGGMPYLVHEQSIYYSNFSDQKLYRMSEGEPVQALTPEGLRYMSCSADSRRKQLICVREDHRATGEAVNNLVTVDMQEGGAGQILFAGSDFVASPVLSPAGDIAAFVSWNHPNMPWDDTQLRIANLNSDGLASEVREMRPPENVQEGSKVSIRMPRYSEDGTLFFIADWSNWWILYRMGEDGTPELVLDEDIEIVSYALESASSAVIAYAEDGRFRLARVELKSGKLRNIGQAFASLAWLTSAKDRVYFVASTPATQKEIYQLQGDQLQVVYHPNDLVIPDAYRSLPESMRFPTGNDEFAYGFYYAPKNADFIGPEKQLPPLIVKVHGGPVAATNSSLNPAIQFWTSRGFAVFDVNHRGSTGYGRAFRKKLYPNWGIVDIEDVSNAAQWLADQAYIDRNKTAIRGGSAGGYTVLASLAFKKVFKAGTSYFGISDLEVLATDTHKFESRYLDQLIGAYPEEKATYIARSPIHKVDEITAPLLLLQGLDDKVVPPNQSEMIFSALKKNCVPSAYLEFEGEGHGFRKPANNVRALNAELSFYGQVFDFTPAGNIEFVQLSACE